ncbi:MAG: hypothetical protein GY906_28465 [bacterium]|nr:hypothetical protein [bacterium]
MSNKPCVSRELARQAELGRSQWEHLGNSQSLTGCRAPINIVVHTSVTKMNERQYDEIMDLVTSLDAKLWSVAELMDGRVPE